MMAIGKIIKREFDKSGMTKTAFAEMIGYSRNNIYNIFERSTIDTSLLKIIGKALHYDFFQHFRAESILNSSVANEDEAVYNKIKPKKSRLSLVIEIDPDDEILMNKEFTKKLKDLMELVS